MLNIEENVYSRASPAGRAHVVQLPLWLAVIRVIQTIFAIIIVSLTAYASSVFGAPSFHGYGMTFFTFAWTILLMLYILATPFFFPEAYNYWIHIGFESLTTLFTMVAFALVANEVASWSAADSLLAAINDASIKNGFKSVTWLAGDSALNALKAALAFGVIQWLLFIISLFAVAMFTHRHRIANNESGFFGWKIKRKNASKVVSNTPASTSQVPVEMPDAAGHGDNVI